MDFLREALVLFCGQEGFAFEAGKEKKLFLTFGKRTFIFLTSGLI